MTLLREICDYLEEFAPTCLAEEWDNVGLLVGDETHQVARVMTCLTVTPASVEEAVRERADLIVTHHPMPFRPLKSLTTKTTPGRLLLRLVSSGIAVYSPHTAFDSAACGINQRLAEALQLRAIQPLILPPDGGISGLGAGRVGRLGQPQSLAEVADQLKDFLRIQGLHMVGQTDRIVQTIAVACGAAGEFLPRAVAAGCDLLVLGETTFHNCLEAEASGIALLLPGHFASERFAVEALSGVLQERFPDGTVWPSRDEQDPLRWA